VFIRLLACINIIVNKHTGRSHFLTVGRSNISSFGSWKSGPRFSSVCLLLLINRPVFSIVSLYSSNSYLIKNWNTRLQRVKVHDKTGRNPRTTRLRHFHTLQKKYSSTRLTTILFHTSHYVVLLLFCFIIPKYAHTLSFQVN
jgi:hypothetical protein